jgi:hypothetical protein
MRGMLWRALGGLLLVTMNALMKRMTTEMSPAQAQFLRYLFGLAVMLPWVMRAGLAAYRPNRQSGWRWCSVIYTAPLTLFFVALSRCPTLWIARREAVERRSRVGT